MNPILRNTLFVSLLLHAVVYLWYAQTLAPIFQPPKSASYTQEFSLVPVIEPPTPTEVITPDEAPASKHMEDDPTKVNASDGKAETGTKTKTKKSKKSQGDMEKEASTKELLTSQHAETSTAQQPLESPSEKFAASQKMESLDDNVLDDSLVESPLTSQEEEKARWRNEVLKRISEQVNFAWVKPPGSSPRHVGRLKIELGADGYLKSVWVHLPSGDPNLDASIMKAVKSIWRFQIPNSTLMNRYYRQLELNYQGG